MKFMIFSIILYSICLNGFCDSLDNKIFLDKKIVKFSSFHEAKVKKFINGNFYKSGDEKVFENLELSGEFYDLGEECKIKGSIMGYQNIDSPLFVNSLPLVSASEFSKILFSLNYTYTVSVSFVFEFSSSCKKSKSFPDVVVINS